ncbi:MAG: cell division protein FtsZ [Candidatus Paceibacterales bacterium]
MVRKKRKAIKKASRRRLRPKKGKGLKKELKKTEKERIKKIKIRVIGIGGGGGSIVSEIAQRVKGASFFAANTDLKALKGLSREVDRFQFGQSLTYGLGTGMNSAIGEQAAKDEREKIKKILEGQDFVILIACLGGGVGSGATPVFAQISKNLGNLTYGIFTLPFKFEGKKKVEIAKNSLEKLRTKLNALSVIPNERIFQIIDRNTPLKKALSSINKSLTDSLRSLIEIIYKPGLINIDFADLKTIFEGRGSLTYLNSIELGEKEAKEEIERVISSPLYPYGIEGAKGVLFNISGQKNLSLSQVNQISKIISNLVYKEAKIIFGISRVKKGAKIGVSLLATGCSKKIFPEKPKRKLVKRRLEPKPRPQLKKKEIKSKKIKIKVSPKPAPQEKAKEKEKSEAKVRKNALQIKKEIEKEEAEIIAKEKFWETPTFLRKKSTQGQ